jgi:nicotinamidase-related amidase
VRTLLCAGFVADVCVQATLADAVFRGYQTVLLRDCTLAAELPHEVTTLARTARTILWIESFLGPTATAADLVQAVGATTAQSAGGG